MMFPLGDKAPRQKWDDCKYQRQLQDELGQANDTGAEEWAGKCAQI